MHDLDVESSISGISKKCVFSSDLPWRRVCLGCGYEDFYLPDPFYSWTSEWNPPLRDLKDGLKLLAFCLVCMSTTFGLAVLILEVLI